MGEPSDEWLEWQAGERPWRISERGLPPDGGNVRPETVGACARAVLTLRARVGDLEAERDELRAEVERLRAERAEAWGLAHHRNAEAELSDAIATNALVELKKTKGRMGALGQLADRQSHEAWATADHARFMAAGWRRLAVLNGLLLDDESHGHANAVRGWNAETARAERLAAVARAAQQDVAARVVDGVTIESCAVQVARTAAALDALHEGDLDG